MMGIKSSVAIDINLRKKLKKLAAILDLTQGQIISNAINDYEKKVLMNVDNILEPINDSEEFDFANDSDEFYKVQLKKASEIIIKKYPKKNKELEELFDGKETIDDFIISSWDSGLGL